MRFEQTNILPTPIPYYSTTEARAACFVCFCKKGASRGDAGRGRRRGVDVSSSAMVLYESTPPLARCLGKSRNIIHYTLPGIEGLL